MGDTALFNTELFYTELWAGGRYGSVFLSFGQAESHLEEKHGQSREDSGPSLLQRPRPLQQLDLPSGEYGF